jgi:hypothetical protein
MPTSVSPNVHLAIQQPQYVEYYSNFPQYSHPPVRRLVVTELIGVGRDADLEALLS